MHIKSLVLNSICGSLQVMSFRRFLRLIPRKIEETQHDAPLMVYRTKPAMISATRLFDGPVEEEVLERIIYERKPIILGDLAREFFNMCDVKFVPKEHVISFFESVAETSSMNYIDPTVLVNFGSRAWFAVRPDDFGIHINQNGYYTLYNLKQKPVMLVMERC